MNKTRLAIGMAAAASAGGPLFLLLIALMQAARAPGYLGTNLAGTVLLAPLALLIGLIFTIPASLVGGLTLGFAGVRFRWARHPGTWAICGFALGATAIALLGESSSAPVLLCGTVGVACALLCRSIMRWRD